MCLTTFAPFNTRELVSVFSTMVRALRQSHGHIVPFHLFSLPTISKCLPHIVPKHKQGGHINRAADISAPVANRSVLGVKRLPNLPTSAFVFDNICRHPCRLRDIPDNQNGRTHAAMSSVIAPFGPIPTSHGRKMAPAAKSCCAKQKILVVASEA